MDGGAEVVADRSLRQVQVRCDLRRGRHLVRGREHVPLSLSEGADAVRHRGCGEARVDYSSVGIDLPDCFAGITFEDAGEHELEGVPDRWHLYRLVS